MPIPKIIHQTFRTAKLPFLTRWHINRFKKNNLGYDYQFYDDAHVEEFIKETYDSETFDLYKQLNIGAAKADFFRYAVLYKRGGIYLDIDSTIRRTLDQFIFPDDVAIISKEKNQGLYVQWALIYEAGHPFLQKALQLVFENIKHNKHCHDVHKMTGPRVYSDAIEQCLHENPSTPHRMMGVDYNGNLKFKYPLSKLIYNNELHWKKMQLKKPVLLKK